MATYYRGHRPILQPRSANVTHLWSGKTGEYSNWDTMNENQLLEGMPDNDHVPGEGRHPHGITLTRRFRGLDTQSPMDEPGLGPDTSYLGLTQWPYPVPAGDALGDAGHGPRELYYSRHTNLEPHQGVPSADMTLVGGHEIRLQEDAPTGGGATAPFINKGVGEAAEPVGDPGRDPHPGEENIYGHFQLHEWKGTPSSKAL